MSVVTCVQVAEMLSQPYARPLIVTLAKCDALPFQLPGTEMPTVQLQWIEELSRQGKQGSTRVLLVGIDEGDLGALGQQCAQLNHLGFGQIQVLVAGLRGWWLYARLFPDRFPVVGDLHAWTPVGEPTSTTRA
jgi:hypothetical protein